MLAAVLTPQQLAHLVRGSVKCDSSSTVVGATRLVARAGGTALDSGVRFSNELSITTSAFALSQVLNFGTLAYVADCYGELHPLHGATPSGNESPTLPPLPRLLGVDPEVLAR
jgi:hypothetical protein